MRPSRPRASKPLRACLPLLAGLSLLLAGALAQPAAALSIALYKVPLGEHQFGEVRQPDGIVAKAGPDEVGFESPPPGADGVNLSPWSFDVARDGSIWLLDQVNQRLLMWRSGQPDGPARTVALPDDPLDRVADFAIAADGTIFATYVPPPGTPEKTMRLAALTPAGKVRWTSNTVNEIFNAQLRFGPDATLYVVDRGTLAWMPVATPAGRPIPVAEQRRRTSRQQPLPGGLRLAATRVSDGQWRFTLAEGAKPLRGWQVTSETGLGALAVTPALVGDDPVVALEISRQTVGKSLYEFEVLRLGAKGGTPQRFALEPDGRTVWGDTPITGTRIGPDGQLYQLSADPKTGASIARYSLGASQTPPPTTTRPDRDPSPTTAPSATQPPSPESTVALPSVTSTPATPTAARSSGQWLIPGLVALAAGLLAGVGAWQLYRRSHPEADQDRPDR